ncbi:MAG: TIGR04283 family arsenosugar biosynthesis glycosyltransferase [Pseudomonadota bacterium]
MRLSIVIPVLNEERALRLNLPLLSGFTHEVIVVDGGSLDRSLDVARKHTPHVFISGPGRGKQQDLGAHYAHGDAVLFLHADTRLPHGFDRMIEQTLFDHGASFGAFRLKIHPSKPMLNLIALMATLRSRFLRMPYGDQALFMRKKDYLRAGGFQALPLMEDVDLVRRLNRIGKFGLARGYVRTSPRRWEKQGALRTTFRNWSIMMRYLWGESPQRLYRLYYKANLPFSP